MVTAKLEDLTRVSEKVLQTDLQNTGWGRKQSRFISIWIKLSPLQTE